MPTTQTTKEAFMIHEGVYDPDLKAMRYDGWTLIVNNLPYEHEDIFATEADAKASAENIAGVSLQWYAQDNAQWSM